MGRNDYHDLVTIVRMNRIGLLDCLDGFSTKTAVESTGRMLTVNEQRIVVGQASRLIEEILTVQGSKEDLLDAIKYGLCCLDADKYGLDIAEAQLKFRYQELYVRYMPDLIRKGTKHE